MKIDINYLKQLKAEIDAVNGMHLEDIELYDGLKKIEIPPSIADAWHQMGSSNVDFIIGGFYKKYQ